MKAFQNFSVIVAEPQQRAHSPQLAAGLASEYKIRFKVLTGESRRGGTVPLKRDCREFFNSKTVQKAIIGRTVCVEDFRRELLWYAGSH